MMFRRLLFLLIILAATVSCSALENISRVAHGEGQPIYVASSACALPCFYGMTPGETRDARALAYINSLPQDQQVIDNPSSFFVNGAEGNRIQAKIPYTYPPYFDVVDSIELETDDYSPILRLRQFVDQGWIPKHVRRIRASLGIVLLLVFGEHNEILAIVTDDSAVNANSPIISLYLLPAQNDAWLYADICDGHCHFDDEIAWLGYASRDDYWAEKPLN